MEERRAKFPAKVFGKRWNRPDARPLCIMHGAQSWKHTHTPQGISSLKSEWINTARYRPLKATDCLCYVCVYSFRLPTFFSPPPSSSSFPFSRGCVQIRATLNCSLFNCAIFKLLWILSRINGIYIWTIWIIRRERERKFIENSRLTWLTEFWIYVWIIYFELVLSAVFV